MGIYLGDKPISLGDADHSLLFSTVVNKEKFSIFDLKNVLVANSVRCKYKYSRIVINQKNSTPSGTTYTWHTVLIDYNPSSKAKNTSELYVNGSVSPSDYTLSSSEIRTQPGGAVSMYVDDSGYITSNATTSSTSTCFGGIGTIIEIHEYPIDLVEKW